MPQVPGIGNEADPNHRPRCESARDKVSGLDQPTGDDQSRTDDRDRRPIERVEHVCIEANNGEHNGGGAGDRQALIDDSGQSADDRGERRHRSTEDELPSTRRHNVK